MARDRTAVTDDELDEAREEIVEAFDEARVDVSADLDEGAVPDSGE